MISRFLTIYAGAAGIILVVALAVTGNVLSPNPIIIAGQLGGLALMIAARVAFGQQKFNVTAVPADGPVLRKGPYRVLRHPMYAGLMVFYLVSIAGHVSPLSVALGVIMLIMLIARVLIEEQLLLDRYPEYGEYAKKSWRLLPFVF